MTPEQAQRELARRRRRAEFDPAKRCHARQRSLVEAIILRPLRNICALAGRQSGKSFGAVMAALLLALGNAGCNVMYVSATYASCKRFGYKPAVEMNRSYALGGKTNDSDQTITFPGGATVYFLGADRDNTIARLRGTPNLIAVFIDEAGVYDSDQLKALVETVRPGLRPRAGKLIVMGTPSPAGKQGTWFDITENPHFDQHRFDYLDNDRVPSFADVEKLIDEELAAMFPHMTVEARRLTAYFLREYKGQFVVDLAEKVYQMTEANLVDDMPATFAHHLIGGDLGSTACDALVDLAWNDDAPEVYIPEAEATPGQDSLAFAAMAKEWHDRLRPIQMPVDPGGLGQKTIRTVQNMFPHIPIVEAAKPPVAIQVKAVNLLMPRLRIRRGSQLAQELARPTWVGGIVGGEINEHGVHSDLVPALRYACIAVAQYLPAVEDIETDADRARRQVEARASERRRRAELRYNDQSRRDALESDDLPPPEDDDEPDWSPAQPW